jgi:hypothetical protein
MTRRESDWRVAMGGSKMRRFFAALRMTSGKRWGSEGGRGDGSEKAAGDAGGLGVAIRREATGYLKELIAEASSSLTSNTV